MDVKRDGTYGEITAREGVQQASVRREQRMRLRRLLSVLGCIAVFVTAFALILPALSMTRGDLVCDLEEHVHTKACYEKVLVCEQEEGEGHQHSDACYENWLVCEIPEHTHTDACYEQATQEDESDGGSSDDAENGGEAEDSSEAGQAHDESGADNGADPSDDSAPDAASDASSASASSVGTLESGAASDMPAQSFTADLKDKKGNVVLTVSVEAPEGAFPAGTFMKIDGVPARDVADKVEAAVKEANGAGVRVKSMTAVDIAFHEGGAGGKQIEPAKNVQVKITSADVRDFDDPMLVHVVDKSRESAKGKTDDAEVVEKVKIVNQDEDDKTTGAEDTMKFKAREFSPYVIVEVEELTTQVITASGETYDVKVTYGPEAGIPEGAKLQVEEIAEGEDWYEEYLSQVNHELGGSASFARFFDISIVADSAKVQPATAVQVQISLSDAADLTDDVKAVHFAAADQLEVLDATLKDGAVSFDADSFSIYAVVDDDTSGNNARIGYRFWHNDGSQNVLLSTQYFRYKDVHPASGTALEINEPGIPGVDSTTWARIFKGWSKDSFSDNDADYVTIAALNSELSGMSENDFVEGSFTDVYANLKNVYYVTYVDVNPNNVLATEIVPLADSGDTTFTVKSATELRPTIDSDTVLLGWYDIENPKSVYTPGQENIVLDSSITLYPKIKGGSWLIFNDNDLVADGSGNIVSGGASFTPPAFYLNAQTEQPADPTWAGYEFGGWYADPYCTTPFVFGGTLDHDTTVYAKWTPSASAYRVVIWKQRSSDEVGLSDDAKTYDYVDSYLIDEGVVTGEKVTLDSSYTNIYGTNGTSTDTDKGYFTYNASKTDQSVVVKADGSSVLNVYYDRKPVMLNYYVYDYAYTVSTNDNDNNPAKYGDVNGQKARVYWRNGAFRTRDSNNGAVYNGTVYTRSNSQSWQLYESFTGLYGSTLEENGYTWPEEYNWYSNGHGAGGNQSASWWSGYSEGDVSGTRTTFMSSFLPTDNATTVDFYGSDPSGNASINFYVQELDGSYTLKNTVTANRNSSFHISDKYAGYHASQYRVGNGNWTSAGQKTNNGYYNGGNAVSYSNSLDIRFDLTNYTFTFYTNNGSNQLIEHTVPYSKSLSEYADQNPGQRTGYYFLGWYADPGCTEEFDFNQTMPDSNVAVYGKWKMRRVRIVIDPGANNVYMGSQSTRFRLDYDERIDGGLLESATRAGYILDGWYTDPDFTNRFLFSSPVNDDTTDVAWDYQDSPRWAAERAAYGDDTENYENVRGILHLYAKWIPDTNSTGINIVYDPGDAALYDSLGNLLTTVPIDTHMYGFDGTATAREAPSGYNDLYTFKYWEATKKDGTTVTLHSADPIALSELAFTDPIYDENGDLLRETVTLRAVYELTSDPSHVTTITFDGNTFTDSLYGGSSAEMQGRAKDGTERTAITLDKEINQGVTLPTADDFYLDGWELVGWSFTKGTYAEQVAGATDNAPNFAPGTEVAADNLEVSDLNDEGNTLYAMWQPKKYSVTVKQVIEAGVSENSFTYAYKTGVERDIENATQNSETLIGNSSFNVGNLEYYDRVGHVIHVTTPTIPDDADYSVRVNAIVTKDDGTTETLNPTAAGDYQILGDVTITYTYSPKVKVKVQKRDATAHSTVLTGAVFDATPVEYNTTTQHWEDAGSGITLTVNAETIEQSLQEGTYRITETNAPSNYANIGTDLYLAVHKEGQFNLFTSSGGSVSTSIAELTGSGTDEGRVLTVYDNPIRTVTLSKTVEDEQGSFAFKVTVFNSDGSRLGNYTIGQIGEQPLTTNNVGEVTLSLSHGQSVSLAIPHGCKLTVVETPSASYEASYKWNDGESVSGNTFGDEPVAITTNSTLAFTNTLKAVPITLKKVGVNNTDDPLVETPLAGATFTAYTSATGVEIAKDANGTALTNMVSSGESGQEGVFFNGNLKVGTYYLEETSVPAGYYAPLGRFELTIPAPAPGASPTIEGTWVSGSPTGEQGTVTGNATDGYVVTVRNVAGVALPSTGGFGVEPLTLLGIMLIAGAAAFLVARRHPLAALSREWAYYNARRVMGGRVHEHKGFTRIVLSRKAGMADLLNAKRKKR